jgi:oxygen-independent coproporphyrinogen-3 oxidase
MNTVGQHYTVDPFAEITMEMNPGTVTVESLRELRRLGINRASFGAQTFDDGELAKLGRCHNTADTLRTCQDLREAGFDNVSFDLIAGLPGQSLARWEENVSRALELDPEHLSFYLLEVHAGTPLAEHIKKGIQPAPDDDLAAVMYESMLEQAVTAGYSHYEISNMCRPGLESRHNLKYWTGEAYLGFGCSAHSFDGFMRRWSNIRDVKQYLDAIERANSPVVEQRELTVQDTRAEALFLGMRLMRGVDTKQYQRLFGVDLREEFSDDIARFQEAGLVEIEGDMMRLTRTGALLSNEVFAAFM